MAIITSTRQALGPGTHLVTWAGISAGDTCTPLHFVAAADRSVQVTGTFDGASIAIEGSNDNTNYSALSDPQGNALSFTTSRIESVMEMVRSIRPTITGGTGSTSLTVTLLMKE